MARRLYTAAGKLKLMTGFPDLKKHEVDAFMKEHKLSLAELGEWIRLFEKHGFKGLQATAVAKGRRL